MSKQTKPREIDPKLWYIVDLSKKNRAHKYTIFRDTFKDRKEAKLALQINFGGKGYRFEIVKGKEAIEFQFEFKKGVTTGYGHLVKYKYPPIRETLQDKKSYRTKFRRWKRDFDIHLKDYWHEDKNK